METSNFSFEIVPSNVDNPLTVSVWLDNDCVFGPTAITNVTPVVVAVADDNDNHNLHIELSGKTADYTKVDADGNIVSDSVIDIVSPKFDDTNIKNIMVKLAVYQHDTNGTTDQRNDRFYGTMGCNGRVSLPFETPVYLWICENM
jgi:hypothetical protein